MLADRPNADLGRSLTEILIRVDGEQNIAYVTAAQ